MGNKSKIASDIQKYFPSHTLFVDVFFGTGGMFFNKPKAKYNIVNDIDSDVFNLFQVVSNQKDELEKAIYEMPIHSDLLNYWKTNKEHEPVKKAIRFIFLSNFTFMGGGASIRFGANDSKGQLYRNLNKTFSIIHDVQFYNSCFKDFFKILHSDTVDSTFIYADPPYLGTDDNYSHSFTEADSLDLFNCLQETGCKYAMSEFDHPFILEQAKQRGLNVVYIGERQNLKNRRTEILVMNYNQVPTLFQ